jgi:hypothetical protein
MALEAVMIHGTGLKLTHGNILKEDDSSFSYSSDPE